MRRATVATARDVAASSVARVSVVAHPNATLLGERALPLRLKAPALRSFRRFGGDALLRSHERLRDEPCELLARAVQVARLVAMFLGRDQDAPVCIDVPPCQGDDAQACPLVDPWDRPRIEHELNLALRAIYVLASRT